MNIEIAASERNHTWALVILPPGHKAIGCHWAYKIKYNSDDFFGRYKAQLRLKVMITKSHFLLQQNLLHFIAYLL